MAKRGADGSVILYTEVDTSGVEKGTHNIKNIASKTGGAFKNLGNTISKALSEGDVKTAQLANNFQKATTEVEKQTEKVSELKKHLSQLKSGEFKVKDAGVTKLQKDFEKATAEANELSSKIDELSNKQNKLIRSSNTTPMPTDANKLLEKQVQGYGTIEGYDRLFPIGTVEEVAKLEAELNGLGEKLEKVNLRASQSGEALKKAVGISTQSEIDKTKAKLNEAERKLDNLSTKAEIAEKKLKTSVNDSKKQIAQVGDGFDKMGTKLFSLAKGALIFSAITKGFTSLRENIASALMSNDCFRESVYQLQAALWTVSEPIYQAILPALQKMIRWLTIGILYIATFFSALGGKSLKQTIASAKALNKQAQAYDGVSKSSSKSTANNKKASKSMKDLAKQTGEANKELADFDDLMILQKKTIDDINTPATESIGDSGIQSGFDDLESLLNDSDMENLTKFQEWVMDNKESIKTALEIAGLVALGLGIGKLISKIGELLGWFNKKDKALDTQTEKTEQEEGAVNALANAFAFAQSPAYGLAGALAGVTAAALGLNPQLEGSTSAAYGLAPAFETATNSALGFTPSVNGVENALHGAEAATQTMEQQVTATMPNIKNNVSNAFENAAKNTVSFSQTKWDVRDWCLSVKDNIKMATDNLASNVYEAFNSAVGNISDFASDTSTSIAQWSKNIADNTATAASRFASNWGEAIKSAWDNFRDFMKATGEKVSGFFSEHKATIITVGALTGLTIAGIALAPYTGGASLALPALAEGGIVPYATTALIGEAGKEAVLPLENNTEWMDILADRILQRNGGASGGNTEVVLEIDGREFGRAVVEQGNKENRRIGTRLVIV